jgi:hypothetical protein
MRTSGLLFMLAVGLILTSCGRDGHREGADARRIEQDAHRASEEIKRDAKKASRPFRKLARKSVKNGMKRREETGPGPKSSAARAHRRLPKPAGSRLPVTLAWACTSRSSLAWSRWSGFLRDVNHGERIRICVLIPCRAQDPRPGQIRSACIIKVQTI